MNYKMIGRFLAMIAALEAVCLLPAAAISLGCGEWNALQSILGAMAIMLGVWALLRLLCRRAGKHFSATGGMLCVGLGWVTLSVLGCLPFVFSGEIPVFIDALFEMVSGFTTTGASILSGDAVEALPFDGDKAVENIIKNIIYLGLPSRIESLGKPKEKRNREHR